MKDSGLPTPSELAILNILWSEGPRTVRQVHDALKSRTSTGYTTTLKLMQIMLSKGLVQRDESSRSHIYQAALAEDQAQVGLVSDLMDRAFGGSSSQLLVRALEAKPATQEELDEIRKLLEGLEGEP